MHHMTVLRFMNYGDDNIIFKAVLHTDFGENTNLPHMHITARSSLAPPPPQTRLNVASW
jgi:hypothetical protein